MSLYKDTYETIVTNIANAIYEAIDPLILEMSPGKNMVFYALTTANNLAEYRPGGNRKAIASIEKINETRTKPSKTSIKTNLKTFLKNTLGFTDSTFNQVPNGNDMLAFIFAVNSFIDRSITNVALDLDTSTILYNPASSGHTNRISLDNNIINNNIRSQMYSTLQNANCASNTGGKLTLTGSITSSCSSSSCSSSSSSSSSCSCSSSSMFIVYFNI